MILSVLAYYKNVYRNCNCFLYKRELKLQNYEATLHFFYLSTKFILVIYSFLIAT